MNSENCVIQKAYGEASGLAENCGALPYTGIDVLMLIVCALLLIAVGLLLRKAIKS